MERIRGYTAIKTPTKDLLRKGERERAENKEEEATGAGRMRRRRAEARGEGRGPGAGKWQLEQLRVIAPRLAQRSHKPPPEVCRATGCPSYAESKEEILIRDASRRATLAISLHAFRVCARDSIRFILSNLTYCFAQLHTSEYTDFQLCSLPRPSTSPSVWEGSKGRMKLRGGYCRSLQGHCGEIIE